MSKEKTINSGSGLEGGEYEINLLLLYALRAYQTNQTEFELNHGLERYLKLDDIILITDNSRLLCQAKHKQSARLTKDELLGDKGDFSLVIYAKTFKDVFLGDLQEVAKAIKTTIETQLTGLTCQIKEAFEKGDDSYKTFLNELISASYKLGNENVLKQLTLIESTKIHIITNFVPNEKLNSYKNNKKKFYCFDTEEFLNQIYSKVTPEKIPKEFVRTFLNKLELHIIDQKYIDKYIFEILQQMPNYYVKDKNSLKRHLFDEFRQWSQNKNKKWLTKLDIERFFANFYSTIFIEDNLKKFENDIDFDVPFKFLPLRDKHLFTVIKTSRDMQRSEDLPEIFYNNVKEKFIFVEPDVNLDIAKDSFKKFQFSKFIYCICSINDNQEILTLICEMFDTIKQNKKIKINKHIILLSKNDIELDANLEYVNVVDEKIFNSRSYFINNSNKTETTQANDLLTAVESDRYFLILTKLQQIWVKEITRGQILFVNPLTKLEIQKLSVKSFVHQNYTHIFCPLIETNINLIEAINTISTQIRKDNKLNKYKKIVLFLTKNIPLGDLTIDCRLNDKDWFKNLELNEFNNQSENQPYISRLLFKKEETKIPHSTKKNFTEEDFIQHLLNEDDNIFIISTHAGMGKSSLVTSLTNKINRDLNYWALKISLNHVTKLLCQHLETQTVPQLLDFVRFQYKENIFKQQLATISENIIVFLDAVDEISPDYFELIVEFIRNIKGQVKGIILTTRDYLGTPLEKDFNVNSYEIKTFTPRDICSLICQINRRSFEEIENWYYKETSGSFREFLGTPLHIKMFVEILEYKEDITPQSYDQMNLALLYDDLLIAKQKIYMKDKNNYEGNVTHREHLENEYKQHMEFCMQLAMETFIYKQELLQHNLSKYPLKHKICRIGIIEYSVLNETYYFIHRTLLEYFISKWIMINIYNLERCPSKLRQALFKNIFSAQSLWDSVRQFLEDKLRTEWDRIKNEILDIPSKRALIDHIPYEKKIWKHLLRENQPCLLKLMLVNSYVPQWINKILESIYVDYHKPFLQDPHITQYLIDRGANINGKFKRGLTVIHMLAIYGNATLLEKLIEKYSININVITDGGSTALHFSIFFRRLEVVKVLVNRDPDYNIPTGKDLRVFCSEIYASKIISKYNRSKDIPKFNLIYDDALECAASTGDLEIFRNIYFNHEMAYLNTWFPNGVKYLRMAGKSGNNALAKFIISKNICNLAEQTVEEWNDLHEAAIYSENIKLIEYFVRLNIKFGRKLSDESNFFLYAAKSQNFEIMQYVMTLNLKTTKEIEEGPDRVCKALRLKNYKLLSSCRSLSGCILYRTTNQVTLNEYNPKTQCVNEIRYSKQGMEVSSSFVSGKNG